MPPPPKTLNPKDGILPGREQWLGDLAHKRVRSAEIPIHATIRGLDAEFAAEFSFSTPPMNCRPLTRLKVHGTGLNGRRMHLF